jgi:hypothetical protein
MRRFLTLFVAVVSLTAVGACDSESPLAPTGPSAPVAAPPSPPGNSGVVAVAGIVQDRAWRRLLGGRVEVLDGPNTGLAALVDHRGQFHLAGAFDETTRFRATAAGHQPAILRLPERCAACNPNWWLFFSLDTESAAADLSGEYTLTFRADASCTQIPEHLRSRTYAATIRHSELGGVAAQFTVTLQGGSFPQNFDRADLGVAGDYFAIPLGDYHGTPGFAEEVAPLTYLTFEGTVEGSLAPLGSGTLTASLNGEVGYCEMSGAASSRVSCTWGQTVSRALCPSTRHEVTLQRTSSASRSRDKE